MQSFLLATWFLSALVDFLLSQAFQFLFDYEVEELPAGMWVCHFSCCSLGVFYDTISGIMSLLLSNLWTILNRIKG